MDNEISKIVSLALNEKARKEWLLEMQKSQQDREMGEICDITPSGYCGGGDRPVGFCGGDR